VEEALGDALNRLGMFFRVNCIVHVQRMVQAMWGYRREAKPDPEMAQKDIHLHQVRGTQIMGVIRRNSIRLPSHCSIVFGSRLYDVLPHCWDFLDAD